MDPWTLGENYNGTFTAAVNSPIRFNIVNGPHGVYRIPSDDCAGISDPLERIQEPEVSGQVNYTFKEAGTYYFAW